MILETGCYGKTTPLLLARMRAPLNPTGSNWTLRPRMEPADPRLRVIQDESGRVGVFTSASPRCLDGGDVDLLHRHHRLEGTLCLTATSRKRIG